MKLKKPAASLIYSKGFKFVCVINLALEARSEPFQVSKIEAFAKMVNGFQTAFTR